MAAYGEGANHLITCTVTGAADEKTAETVAAADNVVAETETVKEGNIFTRLWQRIVDLFKF